MIFQDLGKMVFLAVIFIELEPNISVLVLGILSKYCFDPLVLWLCSSLKGLKNWSKTAGRLLARLSKTNIQLLRMILFFKLSKKHKPWSDSNYVQEWCTDLLDCWAYLLVLSKINWFNFKTFWPQTACRCFLVIPSRSSAAESRLYERA